LVLAFGSGTSGTPVRRWQDQAAQSSPRRGCRRISKIRSASEIEIRRDPLGQHSTPEKIPLGLVKVIDVSPIIRLGVGFDNLGWLAVDLNADRRPINGSRCESNDKPDG